MSRTEPWEVSFVGTGALLATGTRGLPATLVTAGTRKYLFDCGDGTFAQLRRNGEHSGIDVVALTSAAGQEATGLLTLAEVTHRDHRQPLRVVGPKGLRATIAALSSLSSVPEEELFDAQEVASGTVVDAEGDVFLEAVDVTRGPGEFGLAYMIYEMPVPGRVDVVAAKKLGIKGADFSRLQAGETVRGVRPSDVVGPSRRGRRLVLAGRGRSTEVLRDSLQGAEVGIFAAPFMDDRLELAEDTFFFTGWEAAELCQRANVGTVLLQRIGPYAPVQIAANEARQFHPELLAPYDGELLRIPLSGSGTPMLIKRERKPAGKVSSRKPHD